MPTPEGKTKDMIKQWCKDNCYWYFMPVSAGYGKHGIPDFIICAEGFFLAIEAKGPGGEPTKRQEIVIDEINAADGLAWVVRNEDDLRQLAENLQLHILGTAHCVIGNNS